MFNELSINNFRGIKNLEIDSLSKINIFIGKNNCGKTSILESIFLITGMSNPLLNITINNFRDLIHNEISDFEFIFRNLDYNNTIEIKARDNNNNQRILNIEPFYQKSIKGIKTESQSKLSSDSISNLQVITGLELKFSINQNKYESKIEIDFQNDITKPIIYNQDIPKKYEETYKGTYITPKLPNLNLDKKIEKIMVNKKQKQIISYLSNIDSNITDITLGTNGMIYFDVKGIAKLIPINLMGDGIRRIISILATIIDSKNGIVIIDEIDNGLHFTSLTNLWESILSVSSENNVQLFITSHNYEILKYLNEVLQGKDRSIKKSVVCYSIRKNNEIIKAYKYNYEEFNNAIIQGIEIR